MTDFTARLVLDSQATLGEGPVWDERHHGLWFVDIEGRMLHRWHPASEELHGWDLPDRVGCALPTTDPDELIVGCGHALFRYRTDDGSLTEVADPEPDLIQHRFNDGKVDPTGRLWAGTMVMGGEPNTAALYRLDPDGELSTQVRGVQISNGLAWSADLRWMYYIDTPTGVVRRFAFDADTGRLADPETCVAVAGEDGHPDGMCIDHDGLLWVAHYAGEQVIAYDPSDGSIRHRVRVPARNVTSCCWGGPDGATLYITTARQGTDVEAFPQAGGIFAVRPGSSGPAATWFSA